MNAVFAWDEGRLKAIKRVLKDEEQLTDDDIANKMYFQLQSDFVVKVRHVAD